jgi:hypothetical protein
MHPIMQDDSHAAESATTGKPVDALFSEAKLAELRSMNYRKPGK